MRVLIRGDSLVVGGAAVTAELGVLLPVRIETRFKNGDLWLRVVPDEPWFVRDDPRITPAELAALQRYAGAPPDAGRAVPCRLARPRRRRSARPAPSTCTARS